MFHIKGKNPVRQVCCNFLLQKTEIYAQQCGKNREYTAVNVLERQSIFCK